MNALKGTGVALVTPFKKDLSVDHDALERAVNYNIDNARKRAFGPDDQENLDQRHGGITRKTGARKGP